MSWLTMRIGANVVFLCPRYQETHNCYLIVQAAEIWSRATLVEDYVPKRYRLFKQKLKCTPRYDELLQAYWLITYVRYTCRPRARCQTRPSTKLKFTNWLMCDYQCQRWCLLGYNSSGLNREGLTGSYGGRGHFYIDLFATFLLSQKYCRNSAVVYRLQDKQYTKNQLLHPARLSTLDSSVGAWPQIHWGLLVYEAVDHWSWTWEHRARLFSSHAAPVAGYYLVLILERLCWGWGELVMYLAWKG